MTVPVAVLYVILPVVVPASTENRQTCNEMRPRAGHSAVLQALCSDIKSSKGGIVMAMT